MKSLFLSIVFAFTSFYIHVIGQTTYYSKSAATDFNDPNSWSSLSNGTGASPVLVSENDNYVITNNCQMTMSANCNVRSLLISSGVFTINDDTLKISRTGYNNTMFNINGGTLKLENRGRIILNGSFSYFSGSFTQTGGSMIIDGNSDNVSTSFSVASGTPIFKVAGSGVNCSAGTITIVDPPKNSYLAGSTVTIQLTSSASINSFSGTHTFIMGDGVSTALGNTDGFCIEANAEASLIGLQNVIVNGGALAGRCVTPAFDNVYGKGLFIKGKLTINPNSIFKQNPTANAPATQLMIGSIENNGSFNSIRESGTGGPTLNIGGHINHTDYVPTSPSVISGTGDFFAFSFNAYSVLVFPNIIFNNPLGISFEPGTLTLKSYQNCNVSKEITFAKGVVNTNGQEFILGLNASSIGTLSYTDGGFSSGTTFGRWYNGTGSAIAVGSEISIGTGSFPFISGGNKRHFHIGSASVSGAGLIKVKFIEGAGLVTSNQIIDAGYTINRVSNASWVVTNVSNITSSSSTTLGAHAENMYSPKNLNSRLLINNAVTGNNQNGTISPVLQRSGIVFTNIFGTIKAGIASADLNFQTYESGNWDNANTWGGIIPTCNDDCNILAGHTVEINTTQVPMANCKSLTILPNGTLNVLGDTLNIGCNVNNASFLNKGTLKQDEGFINVNGNLNLASSSTFIQNGGTLNIDGNSGTNLNNVISGVPLLSYNSNNVYLQGGNIYILSPHKGNNAESAVFSSAGVQLINISPNHNFHFGNGTLNKSGNSVYGFSINATTNFGITFGTLNINTPSITPIKSYGYTTVLGDLKVLKGDFQIENSSVCYFFKNVLNNGTVTTIGQLSMGGNFFPSNPSTAPQTISGTGIYRNNVISTSSTANFMNLHINNTSNQGVSMDNNALLCTLIPTNKATTTSITFTNGVLDISGKTFYLGTSVSALGTLSVSNNRNNGFKSGSTLSRWFPVGTGGTTITSAANPTLSSTGHYPFISSDMKSRSFFLEKSSTSTTGGQIAITYNENTGAIIPANYTESAYNINQMSSDQWTLQNIGITGSPTFKIAISAVDLLKTNTTNTRILQSNGTFVGTNQVGTNLNCSKNKS